MAVHFSTNIISPSKCSLGSEGNRFDQLVAELKDALGPSSGLDSADVNVVGLMKLMEKYNTQEDEWIHFAFADQSLGYTRNLVDEGNGKSNLLVLVWTPGKGSPIHDHGDAHCLMKILKGNLTEIQYAYPKGEKDQTMKVACERTHKENAVAYIADELGVHQIINRGSDFAVSLHLYTPPNVARSGCNIFQKKTGKSNHVSECSYYSAYGRQIPE